MGVNGQRALDKKTDFFIQQIETTLRIINKFENATEFSPTMLLNSLLSLVVLPFEESKKRNRLRIFPGSYSNIIKGLGITPIIFQPIKSIEDQEVIKHPKDIYTFLRKFRNAIAHQNIEISVDSERRISIRIYNVFQASGNKNIKASIENMGLKYNRGRIIDFELSLTIKQLQKLAIYIANSYLNALQ